MGELVTVNFRNDTIFGFRQEDGIYIAVAPICETLGLVVRKQRERIMRDPILSEGGTIMVLPSPGGPQETLCLRLELIHGWLFTLDESRVRDDETKQKVLAYKRECYRVLYEHFMGKGKRAEASLDDESGEEPVNLRKSLVTETRHTFGTQAAREMWFKMNLPVVPSMLAQPETDLFSYSAIKHDQSDQKAA